MSVDHQPTAGIFYSRDMTDSLNEAGFEMMSQEPSVRQKVSDVKLEQDKQHYLKRVISLCSSKENNRPLNIAIVGPAGVGKSAFVNTIAAAFSSDTWREYAYSGWHGDGSQITVFTKSFPKCCHDNDERFKDVHLPTLIDIAGFTDEERERFIELLRIVFYGRLPEGESLAEADEYYKTHGLEGLRSKYSQNDEKLKVDRVVFVSAATNQVPNNLINCVVKAARPTGTTDNLRKRTIPIYGVMTKQDKIGTEGLEEETYKAREKQFIHALGLGGSLHRFLRCRNYCDDVDHGYRTESVLPELDLPALKFMTQLVDPVIEVLNDEETYAEDQEQDPELLEPESTVRHRQASSSNQDNIENYIPQRRNPSRPPRRQASRPQGITQILGELGLTDDQAFMVIVAMEAVLMLLVLQFLTRSPIDIWKLRGACSYMEKDGTIDQAHMRELCNSSENAGSGTFTTMIGLALFVAIRYGVRFAVSKIPNIRYN